uniref:Uncharacterized protein n=1 Tax=Avena sativa TaxID=4498 RepID=A0ACD5W6A3_AVESA
MGWAEKTARKPTWCSRRGRRWRARHPEILALAPERNRLNRHRPSASPLLPLAGAPTSPSRLLFSPSPDLPHLPLSASLYPAQRPPSLLSPAVQRQRAMDQFHDRQHVWLRSRKRGRYLHADDDGVGVSLCKSRASMNAAWAVHLYLDDRDGIQYVLLQSAAYGRYLAGTDTSAPLGRCGFRVEQRNYDQTPQADAIRWQAVRAGLGVHRDDIMLRHVGTHFRYLRANGKFLRWIHRVTVDEYFNISSMMQWVVEPILPRQGMPRLPRPISERLPGDLSVVILGRAEAEWRTIPYVRAADDGSYRAEGADGLLHFMGRSVHRLREQLAPLLWGQFGVFDFIICLRPGREGRLTPLVLHLPRDGAIEIVVITDGTPGSAELRYPDVDA